MTVLDVRTQQRQAALAAVTEAQANLAAADSALLAAQGTARAATDALATLQREQAGIEAKLAVAPLPADKHQLELELEQNLLAQQPARAALLAAQEALAALAAKRQRVDGQLGRARTDLTAAEAALRAAAADAAATTAWQSVLAGPGLAEAKAAAAAPATTALVASARAAVQDHLGSAEMLALVESRWDDATSAAADLLESVDRAAVVADAVQESLSAAAGDLAEKRATEARAREAVRWAAEAGEAQLTWALDALARVAGGGGRPTVAEQDRIDARATAAKDPAKHETDVHVATVAHRKAVAAFERAALLGEAVDPEFDREGDEVATEREAVETAEQALGTAEGLFPDAERAPIAAWEVAVPAATIAAAADVFRAQSVIERVKALVPTGAGSVAEDLAEADEALADAIEAQALADARTREAADRLAEAADALAAVAATADQRLVAAVRGDD